MAEMAEMKMRWEKEDRGRRGRRYWYTQSIIYDQTLSGAWLRLPNTQLFASHQHFLEQSRACLVIISWSDIQTTTINN